MNMARAAVYREKKIRQKTTLANWMILPGTVTASPMLPLRNNEFMVF